VLVLEDFRRPLELPGVGSEDPRVLPETVGGVLCSAVRKTPEVQRDLVNPGSEAGKEITLPTRREVA